MQSGRSVIQHLVSETRSSPEQAGKIPTMEVLKLHPWHWYLSLLAAVGHEGKSQRRGGSCEHVWGMELSKGPPKKGIPAQGAEPSPELSVCQGPVFSP